MGHFVFLFLKILFSSSICRENEISKTTTPKNGPVCNTKRANLGPAFNSTASAIYSLTHHHAGAAGALCAQKQFPLSKSSFFPPPSQPPVFPDNPLSSSPVPLCSLCVVASIACSVRERAPTRGPHSPGASNFNISPVGHSGTQTLTFPLF